MKRVCFIGEVQDAEEEIVFVINWLMKKYDIAFCSKGESEFDLVCEKTVKSKGGNVFYFPFKSSKVSHLLRGWYEHIIKSKRRIKNSISEKDKNMILFSDLAICYLTDDSEPVFDNAKRYLEIIQIKKSY